MKTLNKLLNFWKKNSTIVQTISSFTYGTIGILMLYISTNLPIFTIGIIFDLCLIFGVYSFIIYICRNQIVRNIFLSLFALLMAFAFICDYLYFDQFGAYASLTEIDNLIWVSQGNSNIQIDAIATFHFISLGIYLVGIWLTTSKTKHLKNKLYFGLANLIFVPFVFIVITVILSSLNGYQAFQDSIGNVYISDNLAYYSQKEFIKYFGYAQMRYEMLIEFFRFLFRGGNL